MRLLDDATVRSFLASVERGDTLLVCLGQTPDDVWAGDVTYAASGEYDGWCIVVFNDCNDFDYVDCVESPDGARMEFPNWPEPGVMFRDISTLLQSRQSTDTPRQQRTLFL